jgi:NADH-quinone oxidoreductase subunit J
MNGFVVDLASAISGRIGFELLAQTDVNSILASPVAWGTLLGGLGLWAMLAAGPIWLKHFGNLLGGIGWLVIAFSLPTLSPLETWMQWGEQIVFWLLAALAVIGSAAAITARKPVYTAIWFAGSLLGVSGLFLFQNAQFLGVATVVVYAGAIVVTFLFVLMLANSEGHTRYDRISWGKLVVPVSVLLAMTLVVSVAMVMSQPPKPTRVPDKTVNSNSHMAPLGAELFARHLVAVEVAGTILLVALVGAVAIVIQGKERRGSASTNAIGLPAGSREGAGR